MVWPLPLPTYMYMDSEANECGTDLLYLYVSYTAIPSMCQAVLITNIPFCKIVMNYFVLKIKELGCDLSEGPTAHDTFSWAVFYYCPHSPVNP